MRVALRLGGLILATALAGMQTVSAAADAEQQRIPASAASSPCTNEAVLTTGTEHLVTVFTTGHIHLRFNFQDVKGVGAVTGLKYVVTGAAQLRLESNRRGQGQFTIISAFHVIAPGTGDHFISRTVFRLVRTPSGHRKAVTHSTSRCTGSSGQTHIVTLTPSLALFAPSLRTPAPSAPSSVDHVRGELRMATAPALKASHRGARVRPSGGRGTAR